MQFHRSLAAIILAWCFPLSATQASDLVPAESVQVALALEAVEIGDAEVFDKPLSRTLNLVIDFASVLHIDGGMITIAIGNSEIINANLADHRTVILTGRASGSTNLIALDESGRVLADVTVRVSARKPGMVTVRRGTEIQGPVTPEAVTPQAVNEDAASR